MIVFLAMGLKRGPPFEVLLDWPLVCKTLRDCARTERDRRTRLFRKLRAFMGEHDYNVTLQPEMDLLVAALCVLHLDNNSVQVSGMGPSVSTWAVAAIARFGPRLRIAVVFTDRTEAKRSRAYVERMIDRKTVGHVTKIFTHFGELKRGFLTYVPVIRYRRGHMVREMTADAVLLRPTVDGLEGAMLARQAKKLVWESEDPHQIEWLDPDPRHRRRCECVFQFAFEQAQGKTKGETKGETLFKPRERG